jgi:hypothetical protein
VDCFLDIHHQSLTKTGEELCGDRVKILKTPEKTILVLSDGLGSGVKANILATLTSTIIVTMTKADVALEDVMRTVIATLPTCKVRKLAYATFTILEIHKVTNKFRIVNFDNPRSLFFKNGVREELDVVESNILDHKIAISHGQLERGDFLAIFSDGVLYAGLGDLMDFGWGREEIANYVETHLIRNNRAAENIANDVIGKTRELYHGVNGDDATFLGVYAREKNALAVFTGPPLNPAEDAARSAWITDFAGRRIVCGGTTGNIVGSYLGCEVETDMASMRADLPPIGHLPGIDLVTEGIFTMAKASEMLKTSDGKIENLVNDGTGASLLARELARADSIRLVVGQSINEWYQNPLLPKSISIRRQLVDELVAILASQGKDVSVEYC